eukprot:508662_1
MPLSHSQIVKQTQTTVLLITIIVLCRMIIAIYLATNQSRLKKSIFSHYCTSTYQVFPTLDVFELIRDPNDFYDEVKMPPHIWLDYVLNPLHEYLKWPRKWITKVSVDCKYYPYKTKACQISIPNRLLRFAMWMAGQPMRTLKRYFKQSKTTVRRDIIFIAHMMNWVLSPVHLYVPKVGSEEYKFLLGNGVFKGLFKDGIYMMDVVKCFIKKPVKFQSNCYDKYKAGDTFQVYYKIYFHNVSIKKVILWDVLQCVMDLVSFDMCMALDLVENMISNYMQLLIYFLINKIM